MSTVLSQETYLPEPAAELGNLFELLNSNAHQGIPIQLTHSGRTATLPVELCKALLQVVEAMRDGRAVTIAPRNTVLTTQESADLLAISRPTLVKLLDDGAIPFERTSHRRKVLLSDLLAYRERRRAAQYAALASTSAPMFDEDEVDEVLADLKEARRQVSLRRRTAAM